jgi:hypothetical protein
MTKRGPYTRKSLSFLSPTCLLFLEEKNALYQAMVELGLRDEMKAQHLSFIYNLGLLAVDANNFVKLNVPNEARSVAFANTFPLAVRLISAHDNLLSFRRIRKCRLWRISARISLKRSEAYDSIGSESPVFLDADNNNEDESASIVDSVLARPSVLFIGMRQPRFLRSVPEILAAAQNKSKTLLVDERDEARCSVASHILGLQVYTLDLKPSESDYHFSVDVCGIARSKVVPVLLDHRFVEITVDPVWMPEAYLSQGLLSAPFFRDALPIFADCLLDNCCVYIPACRNSFSHICDNWVTLSQKFILRFLRKSQTEEIRYCKATSHLCLPDFGKQPLSCHLDKFSLPLKVALEIATGDLQKPLLEFHPGDSEAIIFLALSKKAKPIINRYAPFEATNFDRSQCSRAASETSSLVADTLRFLNQPDTKPAARPKLAQLLQPISPYHVEYLNPNYGSEALQSGKRKVELKQPRFNPLSTGVPAEPSSGEWYCIKCGTPSDSTIPVHYCGNCRITPIRQASLRSPNLSSSKYCVPDRADGCKTFSEESSDSDDNLHDDYDYNAKDHHRIERQKHISEFGKQLTQADIQLDNNNLCQHWMSLDEAPSTTNFWRTIVAVGNPSHSHVKISRNFRLQHPGLLKSVLSKNVYAVEKAQVQVAGFFGLDRNPHAVLGKLASQAFCDTFGGKLEILSNSKDHEYQSRFPYQPIVCNTLDIVGVECPYLLRLLHSHLPQSFLGKPLIEQVDHVLHTGLLCHADEFIRLALPDKRNVLGFHAGPSPKEGAQWFRQNGNGVAIAGLGQNSLKASDGFRSWIMCLNVLISHTFLDRFLSFTSRKDQGIPCAVRQQARRAWLDYQGISVEDATNLAPRLSDAVSLTTGMTVFHFDGLNDSKPEHDNISLGMKSVNNWEDYCSPSSIEKLKSNGLRTTNTAFTALAYQRAINGSITDRINGVADTACPLFKEIVKLIVESKYPFDPAPIKDPESRSLFRSSILSLRSQNQIDSCGRYVLTPEGNNRFTFLGTIVFAWLLVVEEFYSMVCHLHSEVLVAFCMREINGAPLICGILQRLLVPGNKSRMEKALADVDESEFYILLCTIMFEITGCELGGVNCSKRNRWQNLDKSLWDGTALGRQQILSYLGFVKRQFATLRGETDCDEQHARDMLTSKSHRVNYCSEEELSVLKLGAVRGTFGIQLSAWMLVTPSHNAGMASIEKGGSGFYKFVNSFKQREYSGRDLKTEEAKDEERRLLAGLRASGFKVDHAFLDQSCCFWWRKFGTEGKDKRKMDVFFFENESELLYAPMRYRVFSYKAIGPGGQERYEIEFFVFDKWYRLRDYLCPGFCVLGDRQRAIRQQPAWSHGPLHCFREGACLFEDGTSSLF